MWQKVPDYEDEIVQQEPCYSAHGADVGALLLVRQPGKALGSA
jgi:hypothetical protein